MLEKHSLTRNGPAGRHFGLILSILFLSRHIGTRDNGSVFIPFKASHRCST